MEAWISLGSNLGEPGNQVITAIQHLRQLECSELIRCSGLYRTAPWGELEQSVFCNAVAVLDTQLSPHELLGALLHLELERGRERTTGRWGPRCIDLDLLTYNDLVMKSPDLELPHPRMHLRAFVLRPILELAADFNIPGVGPAAACFAALDPPQKVTHIGPALNNEDTIDRGE